MTAQEGQTEVRRHKGRLRSRDGWWDEAEQVYVRACDYDALNDANFKLHLTVAQLGDEKEALRREVEGLRGDLNIAQLQRDAKLCSECPRAALTPDGKDV